MKPLTTLEKLKVALRLSQTDTSGDAQLNQLIEAVSWAIRRRTNRDFNQADRTEYYDGTGTEFLHLNHRPVTRVETDPESEEVGGVWVDPYGVYGQAPDGFGDETKLRQGVDYCVETLELSERNPSRLVMITAPWGFGILTQQHNLGQLPRANWPIGRGNVKVVYRAGYRNIPEDLELAVHLLCAVIRNAIPKGSPLKSETLGRYAYELLTGPELASTGADIVTARSIIAGYTECPL